MIKVPNRKITNEIIEENIINVYHFVNSNYKPDWESGYGTEVDKEKKLIYVPGYNSGFYPISELLEKLKIEGKIIPEQDYLIEINVKLTKLKDIESELK